VPAEDVPSDPAAAALNDFAAGNLHEEKPQ